VEEVRHQLDDSMLPSYVYVEDKSDDGVSIENGGQTVLLNSFIGFNATNAFPPDPTIAAGPNHLIAMVNGIPSWFRIFDKQGNVLKTISALAWWNPVSSEELGDPQVFFDHYSGRWVMLVLQVNFGNLTSGNLIAYSDDDDPLGVWYVYRLDSKMHGSQPSNTWGDYPKLGFDEEAIYIMTRCIPFGGGDWYSKIRIISKTELYNSNGGPLSYTDIWNIKKPNDPTSIAYDVIHPAISYTQGSGGWFFYSAGWWQLPSADYYILYKVTNPLTNPGIRGKVLNTQLYFGPPNANQLGGGLGLETMGLVTRAPIVRDDTLYVAHDIQNSTNSSYSSIKYLKVDLNTPSITEQVEFGSIGYFYLYSALTVDSDHNIAITYSRSADNEYVGAYYTTRHLGDPPDLSQSHLIAEGKGNYQLVAQNRNRWGDYMGIYLDPENNFDIWMLTEYAAGPNAWGTYVAQVRMVPLSGVFTFANPLSLDFGDVEVGDTNETISVIISNYGDQDLEITDIPTSVGDFNLESTLSFPITLASYDSLEIEFSFSPTVAGDTTVVYTISSNDPVFTGLTLTGNGYKMYPALDKTIYASTGSQNNGDILTIDKTTGIGTTVGPSLFSGIKDITIHPTTGIMYGLVTRSGDADIVRVSAAGDAYLLSTVAIPTMAGIAFNTAGTLYGITSGGELYTIDITNGTTTFVVTGEGSYSGITFNPVTNELWASSRSFIPPNKDAIFTVDFATGDTTIIGHTALNIITNDIVFDEMGNLYGVIGGASEINDFISIDVTNGVGTVVGSVGFKNVLGMAFEETGITGIEGYKNEVVLPTEFSLEQNYPNPFNPSTKIKYSIPQSSNVVIKVFDILGNEIETLVNEEKQTGTYEITWYAENLPSGIYFYRLHAGDFVETKKMILMK